MPSKPVARALIAAMAVVVLAASWPQLGWKSLPLTAVLVVLALAGDNSNRQRQRQLHHDMRLKKGDS